MSDVQTHILWTRPLLKRFKAAYSEACSNSAEEFTFEGSEFFTPYVKYLIEHLDNQINTKAIQ